jgi:hypothetical protein
LEENIDALWDGAQDAKLSTCDRVLFPMVLVAIDKQIEPFLVHAASISTIVKPRRVSYCKYESTAAGECRHAAVSLQAPFGHNPLQLLQL